MKKLRRGSAITSLAGLSVFVPPSPNASVSSPTTKSTSGRPPKPPNLNANTNMKESTRISRPLLVTPNSNIKIKNSSRSPSPNLSPSPSGQTRNSSNTSLSVVSTIKSSHTESPNTDKTKTGISTERRRTVTALTTGVASSCKEASAREEKRQAELIIQQKKTLSPKSRRQSIGVTEPNTYKNADGNPAICAALAQPYRPRASSIPALLPCEFREPLIPKHDKSHCTYCSVSMNGRPKCLHPYWPDMVMCEPCSKTLPRCFACERKAVAHKSVQGTYFQFEKFEGNVHVCGSCCSLDIITDLEQTFDIKKDVIKFYKDCLGIQFNDDMLAHQDRSKGRRNSEILFGIDPQVVESMNVNKSMNVKSHAAIPDNFTEVVAKNVTKNQINLSANQIRQIADLKGLTSQSTTCALSRGVNKANINNNITHNNINNNTNDKMQKEASRRILSKDKSPTPIVQPNTTSQQSSNSTPSISQLSNKTSIEKQDIVKEEKTTTVCKPGNKIEIETITVSKPNNNNNGRLDPGEKIIVLPADLPVLNKNSAIYTKFGQCDMRKLKTKTTEMRVIDQIYIVKGLPRMLFAANLCHEMLHAYFFLCRFPDMPPDVEEGMCNAVAVMYLNKRMDDLENRILDHTEDDGAEHKNEKNILQDMDMLLKDLDVCDFTVRKFYRNEHPHYGEGFRKAIRSVQLNGFLSTMRYIKSTGKLCTHIMN